MLSETLVCAVAAADCRRSARIDVLRARASVGRIARRPATMYYGPGAMMDADGGPSIMDKLDHELWHACAGPLTSMPPLDSFVMYFPQGHIEQV